MKTATDAHSIAFSIDETSGYLVTTAIKIEKSYSVTMATKI